MWWALLRWGAARRPDRDACSPGRVLRADRLRAWSPLGKRLVLRARAGRHPPGALRARRAQVDHRQAARVQPAVHQLAVLDAVHGAVAAAARRPRRPRRRGLHGRAPRPRPAHPRPGQLRRRHGQRRRRHVSPTAGSRSCPPRSGSRAFVGNAAFVPAGTTLGDGSLVGVQHPAARRGRPGRHVVARLAGDAPAAAAEQRRLRRGADLPPTRAGGRPPAGDRVLPRHAARVAARRQRSTCTCWCCPRSPAGGTCSVPALGSPLVAWRPASRSIACCAAIKRNVVGTLPAAGRAAVEHVRPAHRVRHRPVRGRRGPAPASGLLVGTPFLPPVLRWFGARIGRRTWIGTTYLTEFDLVDDRRRRHGRRRGVAADPPVRGPGDEDVRRHRRAGATIGTRSIVLYDAVVGDDVASAPCRC